MRTIAVTAAVLLAWMAHASAEQMIGAPHAKNGSGLMCRDERALADLTAPDGGVNFDTDKPDSPAGREYAASCQPVTGARRPPSSPAAGTPRSSPIGARPGTCPTSTS